MAPTDTPTAGSTRRSLDRRLIAVRWMGAFGGRRALAALAAFERAPGREVAAEVYSRSIGSRVWATVGLIVDTDRTPLRRWYTRDAWTVEDGPVLRPTTRGRRCRARQWGQIRPRVIRDQRAHTEAIIYSPRYLAVIARDPEHPFAVALAAEMGLPITTPREQGLHRPRRRRRTES